MAGNKHFLLLLKVPLMSDNTCSLGVSWEKFGKLGLGSFRGHTKFSQWVEQHLGRQSRKNGDIPMCTIPKIPRI